MSVKAKAGVLLTIGVVGWGVGYLVSRGLRSSAPQLTQEVASEQPESRGGAPSSGLAQDRPADLTASPHQDARAPASAAKGNPEFLSLVRARGLQEKSRELFKSFPDSESGRALAMAATLVHFGPAPMTPEGKFAALQEKYLQDRPREAFRDLKEGLVRLDADFSDERQYLIQFATRLDVDAAVKMEFLTDELARPARKGGADHPSFFDGSAALTALLQVSPDADAAEAVLRRALRAQENPESRKLLLSLYEAREPQRAKRLRSELTE